MTLRVMNWTVVASALLSFRDGSQWSNEPQNLWDACRTCFWSQQVWHGLPPKPLSNRTEQRRRQAV